MSIKLLSFILFVMCLFNISLAQTTGQLNITTSTSSAGGNYAPRNIVAIWVEDANGNFVKTLLAYAQNRRTHLNTWQAATAAAGTEFNVVDAITGSTRTSHGTRTCSWNATDYNGLLVPDGTYSIWMELTDKNATGNFSSFEFVKGSEAVNLTPANVPSFANISIDWIPDGTVSVFETREKAKILVAPNPAIDLITVSGDIQGLVQICSLSGEVLLETDQTKIDISQLGKGIYLVKANTTSGIAIGKVIKE